MARALTFVLLAMATASPELAGENLGEKLFVQCTGCHWTGGEGSEALGAPNLTTLDPGYLARQLTAFASEQRGGNEKDTFGGQMVLFAKALRGDQNIQMVADYIDTLPDYQPQNVTLAGNPQAGRDLYATCATCHGANAQGLIAFGAPNLVGLQDWYLRRQLLLFKDGLRPSGRADPYALQMSAAVRTLSSEQDIADVVAYVSSLGAPKTEQQHRAF